MTKKFWMVLGSGEPTHRHASMESAVQESQRLARAHPGLEFFVMEATHRAIKTDVTIDRLGDDDDQYYPPF